MHSQLYASWVRGLRPTLDEVDYTLTCPELPEDLSGTLYRVGPSQRILPDAGMQGLHFFDGDGLVHRFVLRKRQLHYSCRFVRSASFVTEQHDGYFNQHCLGTRCERPTRRVPLRQQYNTNVVKHADKLLALVENATPLELSARDLSRVGLNDFGLNLGTRTLSAHPKIDPSAQVMFIHGFSLDPPYLSLHAIDAAGQALWSTSFEVDYRPWVHDLGLSQRFVALPISPVSFDASVAQNGWTPPFTHMPERPLSWLICRREDGRAVCEIATRDSALVVHIGRVVEHGDKLTIDAVTYRDPSAYLEWLRVARAGGCVPRCMARYVRFTLDIAARKCDQHILVDAPTEFPRCNDRVIGLHPRYTYLAVGSHDGDATRELPWNELARLDAEHDSVERYSFPAMRWIGEPVFAPRLGSSAEADGYVVLTSYEGSTDSSFLEIFDARRLASGPLASVPLRARVPFGFHGTFVAGAAESGAQHAV